MRDGEGGGKFLGHSSDGKQAQGRAPVLNSWRNLPAGHLFPRCPLLQSRHPLASLAAFRFSLEKFVMTSFS